MKQLHDFFTMGGYAAYIWSAYGIALMILVGNLISAWRSKRKMLQKIKQQFLMENNR
jgi:heme exporter protein D